MKLVWNEPKLWKSFYGNPCWIHWTQSVLNAAKEIFAPKRMNPNIFAQETSYWLRRKKPIEFTAAVEENTRLRPRTTFWKMPNYHKNRTIWENRVVLRWIVRHIFTRRENSANVRTCNNADCSPQPHLEGRVTESLLFFQELCTSFRSHHNKLLSFVFETRLMDRPKFLPFFIKHNVKTISIHYPTMS